MAKRLSGTQDTRISDLIDTVQHYSNPRNHPPSPPVSPTSLSGHRGWIDEEDLPSLDGNRTPDWFDPQEHADDREAQPGGEGTDLPDVDPEVEVDPAPIEDPGIDGSGIEALAFYAPFHFYGRRHWGIYIRDYGIAYLAYRMKGAPLTQTDGWRLRAAYWFLWRHEYFHFQAEVAASRFEVLTGELATYQAIFHDGKTGGLEEALANAHAYLKLHEHEGPWLSFQDVENFRAFAGSWMKSQPPGYRDYDRWCRGGSDFKKGQRTYLNRTIHLSDSLSPAPMRSAHTDPDSIRLFEGNDYSRVPLVRVPDARVPWLRHARFFPARSGIRAYVHTREHPPVHIHIAFIDGDQVKLTWPELNPCDGERTLTRKEEARVRAYVKTYEREIIEKVASVFGTPA